MLCNKISYFYKVCMRYSTPKPKGMQFSTFLTTRHTSSSTTFLRHTNSYNIRSIYIDKVIKRFIVTHQRILTAHRLETTAIVR